MNKAVTDPLPDERLLLVGFSPSRQAAIGHKQPFTNDRFDPEAHPDFYPGITMFD